MAAAREAEQAALPLARRGLAAHGRAKLSARRAPDHRHGHTGVAAARSVRAARMRASRPRRVLHGALAQRRAARAHAQARNLVEPARHLARVRAQRHQLSAARARMALVVRRPRRVEGAVAVQEERDPRGGLAEGALA
eukprot:6021081-Prymnesium_polylepis.1